MDAGKQVTSVVYTPLGVTEQNTHSDNLFAISLLFALLIIVLVVGAGVWSWNFFFGSPKKRR